LRISLHECPTRDRGRASLFPHIVTITSIIINLGNQVPYFLCSASIRRSLGKKHTAMGHGDLDRARAVIYNPSVFGQPKLNLGPAQ